MITLATEAAVRANLDASAFTTYPLIVLVVPLRLWCRVSRNGRQGLGWDDLLCLIALFVHSGFFFTCMIGLRPSLGKHALTEVSLPHVEDFARNLFIGQIFYTCCITLNKASILAFYWRIFSVKTRIPILAVTAVVVAWFLAILFCVIFTCVPVSASWDTTITDKTCIETRNVWIAGSLVNVLTDAALFVLPIPYVWKLHAPLGQRIILVGMFGLGMFVSIVSIVRFSIMMGLDLNSADATYNFSEVVIWSMVEINCGLICACLPSLKPAVQLLGLGKVFGSFGETGQSGSNPLAPPLRAAGSDKLKPYRRHSRKTPGLFSISAHDHPGTYHGDEEDSYQMIEKTHNQVGVTTTSIEPAKSSTSDERDAVDPPLAIEVKRDWTISGEPLHGPNVV